MKFLVFQNGEQVKDFKLQGANLYGSDGIAVRRAEIECQQGSIECRCPNDETAALTLVWPVENGRRVYLSTTCLSERQRPYIINVELARAKLMQIINKREEWAFFGEIEGLSGIAHEAQDLLIQAFQNISNPSLASRQADESLRRSLVYGEKLAFKQAQAMFSSRGRNRGFGRAILGCRIDPNKINDPKYLTALFGVFQSITVPVNWAAAEPQKGQYDFTQLDKCIQILVKKRASIGLGPLLCFSKSYLPKWLLASKAGFEFIRDAAYDFVDQIARRYGDYVSSWRVISGLNAYNHFGFGFEQVLEMTRASVMAVKAVTDRGRKIVEISQPWGEYYSSLPNTIPPPVYIDMILQSGLSFDAFGLDVSYCPGFASIHLRDMMQVSAVFDYFMAAGKPLVVSNIESPIASASKNHLYQEWDELKQAQWIEQFYKIALSKPYIDNVTYAGLEDAGENANPFHTGLLADRQVPRKSYKILQKLREVVKK